MGAPGARGDDGSVGLPGDTGPQVRREGGRRWLPSIERIF